MGEEGREEAGPVEKVGMKSYLGGFCNQISPAEA